MNTTWEIRAAERKKVGDDGSRGLLAVALDVHARSVGSVDWDADAQRADLWTLMVAASTWEDNSFAPARRFDRAVRELLGVARDEALRSLVEHEEQLLPKVVTDNPVPRLPSSQGGTP